MAAFARTQERQVCRDAEYSKRSATEPKHETGTDNELPSLFEGLSMKNTFHRRRSRPTFRPRLESLETRLTPTTYTVSSLADSGAGSLRAAITSVNGDTSADVIDFSVAGVIQLTSGALPAITNTVKIDGTTAPNGAFIPVVEIDNHGFAGVTISVLAPA